MTPAVVAAVLALHLAPSVSGPGPEIRVQADDLLRSVATWEIFELGGRMLIADPLPTLSFVEDGRFGAYAGCNRIAGGFELSGDRLTVSENMISTKMACPPPLDQLESDLVAQLGQVAGVVAQDDLLSLTNAEGVAVIRLRRSE